VRVLSYSILSAETSPSLLNLRVNRIKLLKSTTLLIDGFKDNIARKTLSIVRNRLYYKILNRTKIPEATWGCESLRTTPSTHDSPRSNTWKRAIRKLVTESWEKRWTRFLASVPPRATREQPAVQDITTYNRAVIHAGTSKAISSLIT
jgi:hypothetical protein